MADIQRDRLKRCIEGGGIQANITGVQGGIRRAGIARANPRNEKRASKLDAELAKLKADLAEQQERMRKHEETCERCSEVRDIQAELRNTTKRNARVAQMLYGTCNGRRVIEGPNGEVYPA